MAHIPNVGPGCLQERPLFVGNFANLNKRESMQGLGYSHKGSHKTPITYWSDVALSESHIPPAVGF